MKIKELKDLFEQITPKLGYQYEEPQGLSVSKFLNLNNLREGIDRLETTGLLQKEIKNLRSSAILYYSKR